MQVTGVGGSGNLANISKIATGATANHTCGVDSSGSVFCWGQNTSGQLGNNSTANSTSPVQVVGVGGSGNLSAITAVSVGQSHTCALNTSGNMFCWGVNANGQLGNNSTSNSSAPVQVLGVAGAGNLAGLVAVGAGTINSCAIDSSGAAYCWGANSNGQLGNNSTGGNIKVPVQVLGVGGSGSLQL